MSAEKIILLGGGGHAKVVGDALVASGYNIVGYVDPKASPWLDKAKVAHVDEKDFLAMLAQKPPCVAAFLGLDCAALERRFGIISEALKNGAQFPPVVHPSAIVSPSARLGKGVQVLQGAIVNADAQLADGVVVNTGAVVEHDVIVGAGSHVAPHATVLGGVKLGEFSYVGSGSVVIQNSVVPARTLIKALSVHK